MHVYLNVHRDRQRERAGIILVELVRKKSRNENSKKIEGRRKNKNFTIFCYSPTKVSAAEAGCFSQKLILCCIWRTNREKIIADIVFQFQAV